MNREMLGKAAGELGQQLRNLDQSYGYEEKRRRLCHQLLRLVVCAYTPPRELEEALAVALNLDLPLKPGRLGYGRKEADKFKAAIMAEKRYLRKHGRPASAYAIAKEVSELAGRKGLPGVSHNTIKAWRNDPEYQIFAFAPQHLFNDEPLSPQLS